MILPYGLEKLNRALILAIVSSYGVEKCLFTNINVKPVVMSMRLCKK